MFFFSGLFGLHFAPSIYFLGYAALSRVQFWLLTAVELNLIEFSFKSISNLFSLPLLLIYFMPQFEYLSVKGLITRYAIIFELQWTRKFAECHRCNWWTLHRTKFTKYHSQSTEYVLASLHTTMVYSESYKPLSITNCKQHNSSPHWRFNHSIGCDILLNSIHSLPMFYIHISYYCNEHYS